MMGKETLGHETRPPQTILAEKAKSQVIQLFQTTCLVRAKLTRGNFGLFTRPRKRS